MKSKKLKIQNLITKGIATIIFLAMILSTVAMLDLSFVFAEETETETEVTGGETSDDDYILSEDDENLYKALQKDIEALKNQLAALNSGFNYENFVNNIANNSIIEISSEVELRALSIYVAQGNKCENKTFKLKNNIHLTDTIEWNPIGDNENPFKGTLDGAGYTVSGILISIKQNYAGLIGYLGERGIVKNLNISNSKISIEPEVDNKYVNDLVSADDVGYNYLGAIVGYSNKGTIANCKNTTSVKGGNIVGGIVGKVVDGKVEYCSNSGYIKGYRTVGGIAGSVYTTITEKYIQYCINTGKVYAITSNAGGIAGTLWNSGYIKYCENQGEILVGKDVITVYVYGQEKTFTCRNAGGIVGWTGGNGVKVVNGKKEEYRGRIENCINGETASVSGYQVVGGIAGRLGGNPGVKEAKTTTQLLDCSNFSEKISQENINNTYVGYIVGYVGYYAGTDLYCYGLINKCYYNNGSNEKSFQYSDKTTAYNNISGLGAYMKGGFWAIPNMVVFGRTTSTKYIDKSAPFLNDGKYKEEYDFNSDGYVNSDDVSYLQEYLAGKTLDENIKVKIDSYGDINNDETIDSNDLSALQKYIRDNPVVKIANNGNSKSFAVAGDVLTIYIPFDENINISRVQPTINNNYANYVGISEDGKKLVFTYEVQGNETENTTLELNGTIYDTFGNATDLSKYIKSNSPVNIRLGDYIKFLSNNDTTHSITGENVSYTVEGLTQYNGRFYINNSSQISVTAHFNVENSSAMSQSITPKLGRYSTKTKGWTEDLNAEWSDDNRSITYEGTIPSYDNGYIYGFYLETGANELVNLGDNKNVQLTSSNTSAKIDGDPITVDKTAPTLTLSASVNNANENNRYTVGEDILITATTSEEIRNPENSLPQINVSFSTSGLGKYNYQGENATTGNAKYIDTITNSDGTVTYRYRYTIQQGDEGSIELGYANDTTITDIAGNETTYTTATDKVDVSNIYADTTAPTVKITAIDSKYDFNNDGVVNNADVIVLQTYNAGNIINDQEKEKIEANGDVNGDGLINNSDATKLQQILEVGMKATNAGKIIYTFTWSEEVTGFTAEDITVNGGIKRSLSEPTANEDGTYSYTMDIYTSVASGNIGELQVIVEQNAVQDLNGNGNIRTESVITVDKKAPTVEITADKEYVQVGKTITYTFNWSEGVTGFDATDITVNNATKGEFNKVSDAQYTLQVVPTNGNDVEVSIADNKCTDIAGNGNIGNKHIISVLPTVQITAIDSKYDFNNDGVVNNADVIVLQTYNAGNIINDQEKEKIEANGDINGDGLINNSDATKLQQILEFGMKATNAGKIIYTFTWSEEVTGFAAEDITVNGGIKRSLSEPTANEDGTYSYTMDIYTSVANGNVGDIQVIVEQNAVQDLNGNGNIRTESVITVDKQAPILNSLEAHATSTISVDENVDTVKEYYKVGDKVTIIATFSENIENTATIPTLALQFSESGNAKGTVSNEPIKGNKITYTYTITAEDMGTLSVKGFSGKVVDAAGNETKVTNRNLDGDTVIADTEDPSLVGITAIAPDFEYDELLKDSGETKRYGIGKQITLIAEYSENIYNLTSTTTEGETTHTVNAITTAQTAPTLKLKFGTGTTRTATFDNIENNKIYYTYDISSGDNGTLDITSYGGHVNDIAGNGITGNLLNNDVTKQYYEGSISEENKVENITADTTKPSITLSAIVVDKDENGNIIQGNGIYYRKGSIITVTAKTNEYVYKNDNKILTTFTKETAPTLNISFATSGTGEGNCTNVEYKNNQTIFTYTYTIKEQDNGRLTSSIGVSQLYDIALGNNAQTQRESSAIADTVNPVTNWQSWVESEEYGIVDNKDGSWTVTFSEILYVYNTSTHTIGSELSNSNKDSAPILLVSNDNITPLETTISNITTSDNKTVITYTYSPYTKNLGAFGMKFASVSDKAGNLFNYKDQVAPTLSKLEVTNPESGIYKSGTEITIEATFSENVQGTAPTLMLIFGDGDSRTATNDSINGNTITYKYTITEGDNGKLGIVSFTGTELKDFSDNSWVAPESVTLTGNEITADTTKPSVTIKAYTDYNTANKKQESGKINAEVTTYEFTWSEDVKDFTIDDITVINAIKDTFNKVSDKVYTLDVINSNEGVQTVAVPAGVCTDMAKEDGNSNESGRIAATDSVEIDRTAPTVRFITPNGGNFTTSTASRTTENPNGTSLLKARIEINEDVSEFKYRVVKAGENAPEYTRVTADQINSSDIDITINSATVGEYVVEVIAVDKAGNEKQAQSNKYVVAANTITLTPNTTVATNQDITVNVEYGIALTQNQRAGIQGKTQSADSTKVIIGENGTVYAEATDIAGNKVYATLEVNNIDKTAPKATIEYTTNEDGSVTATITFDEEASITNNENKNTYTFAENGEFTFEFVDSVGNKGTATAKVTSISKKDEPVIPPVEDDKTAPEITFNYTATTATVGTTIGATITTNEDAIISYSWDNKNWTESSDYTRSVNVKKTPTTAVAYTLYAKAKDKASNTSTVSTLQFTVVNSDSEIKNPEIVFEGLTTIQKDGVKYVKVSPTLTTANLTAKMSKDELLGKTPEYAKLTSDKKLRTGSEITIDGNTKYIVIVNGDVNCDGKVDFLNDIVMINNYRIGINKNLSDIQIMAGDINNSGEIDFIPDIVAMNNYRLGRIKVL